MHEKRRYGLCAGRNLNRATRERKPEAVTAGASVHSTPVIQQLCLIFKMQYIYVSNPLKSDSKVRFLSNFVRYPKKLYFV